MQVRVDQKANRFRAEVPDRRHHLVSDLGVLGIHHEDAIGAGEHADPAAGRVLMARVRSSRTAEQVKIRSYLLRLDFNLGVVDSLPPRPDAEEDGGDGHRHKGNMPHWSHGM